MALSPINNYSLLFNYISYNVQFIKHALSHLGLLAFTGPLVPASNGGRSPSWLPELFSSHSHSYLQCTLHLELPPPDLSPITDFWSFVQ
jgi:hypothetical protein